LCRFKVDTVLRPVDFVLRPVPFEPHMYLQHDTYIYVKSSDRRARHTASRLIDWHCQGLDPDIMLRVGTLAVVVYSQRSAASEREAQGCANLAHPFVAQTGDAAG
jgi:hypothetical protein